MHVGKDCNVKIFLFLNDDDLKIVANVCTVFKNVSRDFQLWKLKAETQFGRNVANDTRRMCVNWVETYNKLKSSKMDQQRQLVIDSIPKCQLCYWW